MSAADDRLASVLRDLSFRSGLGGIRIEVLEQRASGIAVYIGFTEAITDLIDLLGLVDNADRTTSVGRQQLAAQTATWTRYAAAVFKVLQTPVEAV